MSTQAKELSLINKLKQSYSLLFPTSTVAVSSNANGAMLLISDGTPATGELVCAIRICKMASDFTDSVGQTQKIYAPVICQVIEEAATGLATVSFLSCANKSKIDAEIAKCGLKQERYLNATTVVPALSQFGANGAVSTSTKVADLLPDLQWPLSGQ